MSTTHSPHFTYKYFVPFIQSAYSFCGQTDRQTHIFLKKREWRGLTGKFPEKCSFFHSQGGGPIWPSFGNSHFFHSEGAWTDPHFEVLPLNFMWQTDKQTEVKIFVTFTHRSLGGNSWKVLIFSTYGGPQLTLIRKCSLFLFWISKCPLP